MKNIKVGGPWARSARWKTGTTAAQSRSAMWGRGGWFSSHIFFIRFFSIIYIRINRNNAVCVSLSQFW